MNISQALCWLAGWVAASSVGVCGQATAVSMEKDMMACYNNVEVESAWVPGNFQNFMDGEVARLHLHKVMWSSKPVPGEGSGPGLTIITAATTSRLDSLAAQCRSWSGLLVAAVYVPLKHRRSTGTQLLPESLETLRAGTSMARQLFARMEAEPSSCVMRLLLVYELISDELLGRLLPINSLRNTAMLAASTELMAMVDVDLLPSKQLSKFMTTEKAELLKIAETCKPKTLVVMPAFEIPKAISLMDGQELARELVTAGTKEQVVTAASQGRVIPFAEQVYAPGHNATDFLRWYTDQATYKVEYQINYEPWFIVQRDAALLYDARFRGYGWNKATQVAYHNMSGYEFSIHPSLYVVHRPHPKSDAQGVYKKASAQTDRASDNPSTAKLFHRRVATLRHVAIRQMRKGLYENYPGAGVAACIGALPWWRDSELHMALQRQAEAAAAAAALAAAQAAGVEGRLARDNAL